jgi:hypothetical protein
MFLTQDVIIILIVLSYIDNGRPPIRIVRATYYSCYQVWFSSFGNGQVGTRDSETRTKSRRPIVRSPPRYLEPCIGVRMAQIMPVAALGIIET